MFLFAAPWAMSVARSGLRRQHNRVVAVQKIAQPLRQEHVETVMTRIALQQKPGNGGLFSAKRYLYRVEQDANLSIQRGLVRAVV